MTQNDKNKKRLLRLAAIHLMPGLAFLLFTGLVLPRLVTSPGLMLLLSSLSWAAFLTTAFILLYRHLKNPLHQDPDHFWGENMEISLPALKRTVEDMQLGVTVCDLTGRIIYANPAEAQMHGYQQQDLIGKDIGLFASKDQRHPLGLDELQKLKSWKRESFNLTREGKIFPVLLMSDLVIDSRGRPAAIVTTCQDISDRKQIEQDLQESEQQYRQLVESAQEMIVSLSPEGRITFVNQAWLALMGYSWEQNKDLPFCDTVDADSRQVCRQAFLRVMTGVTWHNLEMIFVAADGREIAAEGNLTPQYHHGKVKGALGVFRDITQKKAIEDMLRRSEHHYRMLIKNVSDMIVVLDADGAIRYQSPSVEAVTGFSYQESKGRTVFDYIHPEDLAAAEKTFRDHLKKPGPVPALELRIKGSQGQWIFVEALANNLLDDPAVSGIVLNVRDITGRKKAEQALRESEAKYREHFSQASDGIMFMPADGSAGIVNQAFARMHGYQCPAEMERLRLEDLDTPETAKLAPERLRRMMAGETLDFEVEHYHKDGHTFFLHVSCSLIKIGDRSYFLGFHHDITGRKKAEEALRQSEARYRRLLNSIQSPVLALKKDLSIYYCNRAYSDFVGRPIPELEGRKLPELLPDFAKTRFYAAYLKAIETGQDQAAEGQVKGMYLKSRIYSMDWGVLAISEDVTAQQAAVESVRYSEERFRLLADSAADAIISIDQQGEIIFWNQAAEKIFGYTAAQALGRDSDMLIPERFRKPHKQTFRRLIEQAPAGSRAETNSLKGLHQSGREIPMEWALSTVTVGGQKIHTAIIRDITERVKNEEQLKYLSFHDSLTGLYNRSYFEEEMQRLSKARLDTVGLLICDVDGLKLVNDTMGHKTGDGLLVVIAGIITDACRQGDMVARIGGDEFGAILPNCTVEIIEQVCARIREVTAAYNSQNPELPLSLSLGWVVRPVKHLDANRLFHSADDEMYREKVKNHEMMVNNFIKALQKKNLISEQEIDRMGDLMKDLAKAAGLKGNSIREMELLARYHDIGNVLVADRILLKAGHLDRTEEDEMKRHCEIGYHIVMSTPHLMPHAEWILKHHERWDGKGYPQGLKGEEIPLESRIVALAAAYNAMRQKRPHAKAMTHQQAVDEIRKESGKQFDPALVERFLKLAHKWKDLPAIKAE
jgi:PAS domain S-box-containing protein/diguanylate cyclase (GGDEF)-like protein